MPKETPPFVERLFGEHWEHLEGHPDVWNTWFGPDTPEDSIAAAPTPNPASKENASELADVSHIKHTLDTEVIRFLTEDLDVDEDRSVMWIQSKLMFGLVVCGIAAQFPYFITDGLKDDHKFWLTIIVAVGFLFYGWFALVTYQRSSLSCLLLTKSGYMWETKMPKRCSYDYEVTIRSMKSRKKVTQMISATDLFSSSGKLCPAPLHVLIQKLLREME